MDQRGASNEPEGGPDPSHEDDGDDELEDQEDDSRENVREGPRVVDEVDELLDRIKSLDAATVPAEIHRVEGGVLVYCDTLRIEKDEVLSIQDVIARTWGGGRYRVGWRHPRLQYYMAKQEFRIGGEPLPIRRALEGDGVPRLAPAAAGAPAGPATTTKTEPSRLEALLEELIRLQKAPPPPAVKPVDPLELVRALQEKAPVDTAAPMRAEIADLRQLLVDQGKQAGAREKELRDELKRRDEQRIERLEQQIADAKKGKRSSKKSPLQVIAEIAEAQSAFAHAKRAEKEGGLSPLMARLESRFAGILERKLDRVESELGGGEGGGAAAPQDETQAFAQWLAEQSNSGFPALVGDDRTFTEALTAHGKFLVQMSATQGQAGFETFLRGIGALGADEHFTSEAWQATEGLLNRFRVRLKEHMARAIGAVTNAPAPPAK